VKGTFVALHLAKERDFRATRTAYHALAREIKKLDRSLQLVARRDERGRRRTGRERA